MIESMIIALVVMFLLAAAVVLVEEYRASRAWKRTLERIDRDYFND